MHPLKNKKVAVVGLSVEGLDSVKFLVSQGALVICCDRRSKEALGKNFEDLRFLNVSFQLGVDYLKDLERFDMVVRTPGMLLATPALEAARAKGKEITSLTKLFFDYCKAPIIGITGTKGKGTTSTLIYEMIKKSGKHVYLGGNVGMPLLSSVDSIKPHEWVVLELSSFQLEDLHKSPHIAVVLRVTQEHLANFDTLATNFHATKEAYVEAKKSIVRHQVRADHVVCNMDDPTSSSFAKETKASVHFFSRSNAKAESFVRDGKIMIRINHHSHMVCAKENVQLRGAHNLENIAAASLAATLAGVPLGAIQEAAQSFQGLEHRLEFVRTKDGVSYYNDSFSTVPETAVAGIQSFEEPIILIAGGSEKGSDFTELGVELVRSTVKVLIAIGMMTHRIVTAAKNAGYKGKIITGLTSMEKIVQTAAREATQGDVVLLSPACASFDMFKNYKDRGYQFKHEVSAL